MSGQPIFYADPLDEQTCALGEPTSALDEPTSDEDSDWEADQRVPDNLLMTPSSWTAASECWWPTYSTSPFHGRNRIRSGEPLRHRQLCNCCGPSHLPRHGCDGYPPSLETSGDDKDTVAKSACPSEHLPWYPPWPDRSTFEVPQLHGGGEAPAGGDALEGRRRVFLDGNARQISRRPYRLETLGRRLELPPVEKRFCRICLGEEGADETDEASSSSTNDPKVEDPKIDERFLAPCVCRGSSRYVHLGCLTRLFEAKQEWHNFSCPTCMQPYTGVALLHLAEISALKVVTLSGGSGVAFARSLANMGVAHAQLGNVRTSKQLFKMSLSIQGRHDSRHAGDLTVAMHLATAYGLLGHARRKRAVLEEVFCRKLQWYEPDELAVATLLNNMAMVHGQMGDAQSKTNLLLQSLSIKSAKLSPDDHRLVATLSNLAVAYGEQGDLTGKKELLERALAISERHYGQGHIKTATTLHNLAHAHAELGFIDASKDLLEKSLAIQEGHYGVDHGDMALTLASLGILCTVLRKRASARSRCARSLGIIQGDRAPNVQVCGLVLLRLSTVEHANGDIEAAQDMRLRALVQLWHAYGSKFFQERGLAKCQRLAAIWRAAGWPDTAAWTERSEDVRMKARHVRWADQWADQVNQPAA